MASLQTVSEYARHLADEILGRLEAAGVTQTLQLLCMEAAGMTSP